MKKNSIPFIVAVLLFLLLPLQLAATETTAILEEFETNVLEYNRDLASLRDQLQDALDTDAEIFTLDKSSLSINGGYNYSSLPNNQAVAGVESQSSFNGSASLTIPVVQGISLSGSFSVKENQGTISPGGSTALSISPFTLFENSLDTDRQIAQISLDLAFQQVQIIWESRLSALQYAAARKSLELAAEELEIAKLEYETYTSQYDAGLISITGLQSYADELTSVSQSYMQALSKEADARKELYLLLGRTSVSEDVLEMEVTAEELLGFVSMVDNAIHSIDLTYSPKAEQTLMIEKQFPEQEIASLWLWEPDLKISGNISLPFDSASASVTISISPESFNFDTKREMEEDLADLINEIELQNFSTAIEKDSLYRSYEIAQSSVEMQLTALDQQQLNYNEAELELTDGSISNLDFRKAGLSLRKAEHSYHTALVDQLRAASAILQGAIQ